MPAFALANLGGYVVFKAFPVKARAATAFTGDWKASRPYAEILICIAFVSVTEAVLGKGLEVGAGIEAEWLFNGAVAADKGTVLGLTHFLRFQVCESNQCLDFVQSTARGLESTTYILSENTRPSTKQRFFANGEWLLCL